MAKLLVGDVIKRAKQRADIEKAGSAGFIGDDEALQLCQLGFAQLQNLIINSYEYWIKSYTSFNTVFNKVQYDFNTIGAPDLYKPLAIGIVQNQGSVPNIANFDSWSPLEPYDMQNQNLPASGFLQFTNAYYTDMRYMWLADQLELRPVKAICTVGIYYIPVAPQFANYADELPYWCKPGWEEYIVAFMAWMIAGKEGTGTAQALQVWQMISDQIKNFTPNRDQFNPHTVSDAWRSRFSGGYWGGGFFSGY